LITINPVSISCGLHALGGETNYKTAETYFKDLASKFFVLYKPTNQFVPSGMIGTNHTVFIFSHSPTRHDIGKKIAEYIEKHELGSVTVSPVGHNPIHHSKICVWTWVRDNKKFNEHCIALLEAKCNSATPVTAAPTNFQALEGLLSFGL
jgi:hypothetical protein